MTINWPRVVGVVVFLGVAFWFCEKLERHFKDEEQEIAKVKLYSEHRELIPVGMISNITMSVVPPAIEGASEETRWAVARANHAKEEREQRISEMSEAIVRAYDEIRKKYPSENPIHPMQLVPMPYMPQQPYNWGTNMWSSTNQIQLLQVPCNTTTP